MKHYITTFKIILLVSIIFILGCERQSLDYNYSSSCNLILNIDWSKSGISPQGATAIFYPQDESKYIIFIMGNPQKERVNLPKGIYNVVVFNQTIDEFNYLKFTGIEKYNTFEVSVKDVVNNKASKAENVIEHPDNFAIAKIEGFEITQQMVEQSRNQQTNFDINFTPKSIVSTITISFYVKNVHNIKAAKGTLTGMANCYCIATGCNKSTSSTHYFNLTTIILDGSGQLNGTISGTFTTLGMPEKENIKSGESASLNLLNIAFLLVDNKTIIEKTYTIDNKINIGDNDSGISIEVGTGPKPGEEEKEEDKPIEMPDVKPDEEDGGGLDADVGDWEKVEIEIPI